MTRTTGPSGPVAPLTFTVCPAVRVSGAHASLYNPQRKGMGMPKNHHRPPDDHLHPDGPDVTLKSCTECGEHYGYCGGHPDGFYADGSRTILCDLCWTAMLTEEERAEHIRAVDRERAIYEYAQDDDAYPSTLSGRIANWFSWHVIESIPVLRRRFLERESS